MLLVLVPEYREGCVRDLAISLVLLVLLVRSFGADAEPCVHSPLRMFA